jgi:mediator of RNA polymerase II transcription subunit 12
MTSISSAPSRPPPTFRPPRALPANVKAEALLDDGVDNAIQASEDDLAHPPKRQKIESAPNTSTPPAIPVTDAFSQGPDTGNKDAAGLSGGPWRFTQSMLASIEEDVPEEDEPPALPARPWQHPPIPKAKEEAKPTGRVRKNLPIPNTPDKIESPVGACRFGKSALAGFFPWTGKHPEDVLSEPNIRHGYFDRPPNPPEKEMGSAKNALFSVFKHRSGLETLSVLLGLAVERKCKTGALSSTSNFRPPPRVTLTEAKRKAWLADLASGDVPLRRLSRTIPQGIRGQSLLDQCLSNLIPISRALWFIKCVGANEIRTLKRKGPGGAVTGGSEIKWLKEWTSSVAQFLESQLKQSTDLDWKKNIRYAMGLTYQLYSENLVDRDSFLDWILKAFAAADNNRTPFFLLLVQIYISDIIRFRKRSKRLAFSLVEKLDLIAATAGEVLLPLVTRLKGILRTFVMHRPVCFIMPEGWPRCKRVLQDCLDFDNPGQRKLFQYIELYNEMTAASPLERGNDLSTPEQAIIKLLDQSKAPYRAKHIMTECDALCHNIKPRLLTVMRWATSRYRACSHRLYLAVRLLRLWEREGHDVESVVLGFIAESTNYATKYASLKHLIAELSRSKTVSISNYMQSIIVRGGARRGSFVPSTLTLKCTTASEQKEVTPQSCNDLSQILSEVSLQHLHDHARSLRKLVLARAGFDAEIEGEVIHHCQWFLSKKFSLANGLPLDLDNDAEFSVPPWGSLTWTVKCEISSWLRDFVKAQCKVDKQSAQPLGSRNRFKAEDLSTVRDILEKMGDLAVLADVLGFAANVPDENLLASVVDTINRHVDAFSAIGAFRDLQEKVCSMYLALRPSKLPMTTLATSILAMHGRHPTNTISTRLLQQDLVQGDRGSAAAACSPFSDGVAESLQQAGSHFFDDFEAILQTETNMNIQTMDKLFAVLIERIEKQNLDGDHLTELRTLCQLLARLRLCRLSQSTALITAWVERQMRYGEWRTTTALLVDLVGTGCLPFDMIMECASGVARDKKPRKPTLPALITSLLTPQVIESDPVNYRFETERMQYISENSIATLNVLAMTNSSDKVGRTIQNIAKSSIKRIAMSNTPQHERIHDLIRGYLQHEADTILNGQGTDREHGRIAGKDIVALADDFSLPLCNFSLRLQMQSAEAGAGEELGEAFFVIASKTWTLNAPSQQWATLLPAAGPEAARYVRAHAEEAFFASLPPFLQSRSIMIPFETSSHSLEMATKFLDIAFATGDAVAGQHASSATAQLIEKFSHAHRLLSNTNASAVSPMATSTPIPGLGLTPAAPTPGHASPDTIAAVSHCLPLLLRMTCLQRLSSNTSPLMLTKAAQQEHIKLVVVLCTLALHPTLKTTELPSRILAVVSTLITQPQFTDEMHNYCARLLKDKMRDPRILFLYGSVTMCGSSSVKDVGEGLYLHKEGAGRVGEWKQWVRNWEVIEPSGGGEGSSWVGLGMFDARRV